MAEIKIISNPYEDTIAYEKRAGQDDAWTPIVADGFYSGKLLTERFSTGFFPFKAHAIVDEIIEEYGGDDNPIRIVFEGSDDEFESLQVVCKEPELEPLVVLERSSRYLSNAREIIQDVVSMFGELDPLIRESTEDKESAKFDLDKISEASSNIVPICVLGNYSSGKSTFINALIGAEYLPSAAKPLTAKAYKITRKMQSSGASIRFKLDGSRQVELNFDKTKYSQAGLTKGEPLLDELKSRLGACANDTLVGHVSCAIEVVNDFERDSEKPRISDMVEVEVPFSDVGLLASSDNEFVIFDTPGSNSATQRNHMEVLRRALEGMSNGIPIFVSVYEQLDSDDADELSQQIKSIKGLDSRFTMIVVSRADQAALPMNGFKDADIDNIQSQAVYKKLYSNGMYFVSSCIGLGAKNGGDFYDDFLLSEFFTREPSYSNPDARFYRQLYKYNIMPEQLQKDAIEASDECDDILFVNSGLFCVEYEIENFSEKYAAYNKCRQMEQALERAYDRATADIEAEIASREKTRDVLGEKLDDDTKNLVDEINVTGARLRGVSERNYGAHMEDPVSQLRSHKTTDDLREIEAKIAEAQRTLKNLSGEREDVAEAWDGLVRGLKRNFGSLVHNHDISSVTTMRDDAVRGMKSVIKETREVGEVKSDVAKATVDELLQTANKKVGEEIESARASLDAASKQYWNAQSELLREDYSAIIAGASILPEQTKARLSEQIVKFEPIQFESNVVFSKEDFALRPLDVVIKGRLARAYNQAVNDAVTAISDALRTAHLATFMSWIDSFEGMIVDNITELAPALREQTDLIQEHNAKIRVLGERQAKLQSLVLQVRAKIDWKESIVVEG